MDTKICTKCGESKGLSAFYNKKKGDDTKKRPDCKSCFNSRPVNKERVAAYSKRYQRDNKDKLRAYAKEYRENNKDLLADYQREYYKENKENIALKTKIYREENKDKIKEMKSNYYQENKEWFSENSKKYYQENKELISLYRKDHYQNNKDAYAENSREYREEHREYLNQLSRSRFDSDPLFALSVRVRSNLNTAFKKKGKPKTSRTAEILGCSFKELYIHLIKSAIKNYGFWANFQEYHIDHIIPLATAKTEEDVIRLNHYTNLQFLYPEHNLAKSDRLDWIMPG